MNTLTMSDSLLQGAIFMEMTALSLGVMEEGGGL